MTDRTGILKNSPLIYALASIRFAPWPLMAQKIDEIQDELREIAPLINKIHVRQIGFSGQFSPQIEDATPAQWVLTSSDRSNGFIIAQDQLLFFSKKYTRYADFASTIEKGLTVLLKHMRFLDVTNIGVRYVDHIKVIEGKKPSDYISTNLLPAEFPHLEMLGGVSMEIYKSKSAELRVRCTNQTGVPSIPEDMIGMVAMIQEPGQPFDLELMKSNEILLDVDAVKAYSAYRMNETSEVLDHLDSLHKEANAFFRHESVCTEFAFEVWKGNVQ